MIGTSNESERRKWLQSTLLSIPSGLRLLDAGAGEQANRKYCMHLDYVSQDFCQYEGVGDRKGLQEGTWDTGKIDIVGDITNISEKDESFDVVLCTEVLEHLPSPEHALKEFYRLLKSGGKLILTAPFCSLTHFAPYHYSSGFNLYFYDYHLKKMNFELLEISRNGNYFEYLAQEIQRIPTIAEKYSSQRVSHFERMAMRLTLNMLGRLSKKDVGSDELLCFGYHVIAEKK